jgi:hypothetical protein
MAIGAAVLAAFAALGMTPTPKKEPVVEVLLVPVPVGE